MHTANLVGRLTDFFLIVPVLAFILVVASLMRDRRGSWPLVALLIALVTWPGTARVVRAAVLSITRTGFVEASKGLGASDLRIIARHVLPNASGTIIVTAVLAVAAGILIEATLTFLGLGVSPPDVSLGQLVAQARGASRTHPWLFYIPGGVLVLMCLCVNFVGDGLRDALDPRRDSGAGR